MNNLDLLQNLLSFVKEGSFFSKSKFEKDKFLNFLNTNSDNSIINQTIQNQNLQDNFQTIYIQLLKQSLIEIENYTKQNPQNKSQEKGIIWREAIKEQNSLLSILNTEHFEEVFQKIIDMNKNQNKKPLINIFKIITGKNPKIRSAILATMLLFNITTATIAGAQGNNNPVSQIKQEQILKQEIPKNLNEFQIKAWEIGIKNNKEQWWFEMILKNPNLESFKKNLFVYGIIGNMAKWYYDLILKTINLTKPQIWAWETGAENKMERWYFEMIPNLSNNQAGTLNLSSKKHMSKKYLEIIPKLSNNEQLMLWRKGLFKNMGEWYFEMIYKNSNLSFSQEKTWLKILTTYQNSIKNEIDFKKLVDEFGPLISKNLNFNLAEFVTTSSYNLLYKINDKEIEDFLSSKDSSLILEYKIMISYYLSQRNLNPTSENINKALKIITQIQNKVKDIKVYNGRNIIFLANNEITNWGSQKDKPRFNKEAIKNYFKYKGKSLKEFFPTKENIKTIKINIIDTLINTSTPLTIHFAGHGGKDSLYLTEGNLNKNNIEENNQTIKLSLEDLTNIFLERNKKYGEKFKKINQRDILILDSCYNASFNNKLFKNLANKMSIMPILIGASEEGQYAFSEFNNKFGSKFLSNFLNLKDNSDINIGFLIKQNLKKLEITSNPSMFISGEDGKPIKLM